MAEPPTIFVNHLLEPPNKITGITRYLFSLLQELLAESSFKYVVATSWRREMLPEALRESAIAVVTREFIPSTPWNIAAQMISVPSLMRESGAVLEFNCNPLGCLWPFWPRVLTVHDLYFDTMPDNFPWRYRLWWNSVFPLALQAASKVICVSRTTRDHLSRLYPRSEAKSVVIHEAAALKGADARLNAHYPYDAETVSAPFAVVVGNLSPNKNIHILVEALKILQSRGIILKVLHVGRDELGLMSQAQAGTHLTYPIISRSGISDAELIKLYERASFFISTSIDEGFCLPLVEAQSLGLPVVCSDIPVFREIAGKGAMFFDPRDPIALADALAGMAFSDELRSKIATAARVNSGLFSWSRAAGLTCEVFKAALST